MTKKFAHIVDGAIENTILADDDFVAEHPLDWFECPDEFGIGDLHDGTQFSKKPYTPPPAARKLTKLQFLRLMTQEERIAFRAAAKANPVMEDFMALLDLAEEVDKDDVDVIAGLAAAEAAGLLSPGRAAEILK